MTRYINQDQVTMTLQYQVLDYLRYRIHRYRQDLNLADQELPLQAPIFATGLDKLNSRANIFI